MLTGDQNPEEQNPEEQFLYEFIFRFFRENKVAIANAIKKPFPLFMGLRDLGYLPEQMYEVSEETLLLVKSLSLYYCKLQGAVSPCEWGPSLSYT